ncbi:hypothetical protein LINPERPRIM_LOCUS36562 [Linum perenne]
MEALRMWDNGNAQMVGLRVWLNPSLPVPSLELGQNVSVKTEVVWFLE